jgi:hypothetical protein
LLRRRAGIQSGIFGALLAGQGRARCINAVSIGRPTLEQRLTACQAVYDEHRLARVLRTTPSTQLRSHQHSTTAPKSGLSGYRRHPRDGQGGTVPFRSGS